MEEVASHAILVAGTLFLISILATAITPRLGVPLLLVFLIVGLLAGEDGPGGIHFTDYKTANLAGTAALAVILFDGGLRTPLSNFRVGLRPALMLATVGVLLTTSIVGAMAAWLFDLPIAEGLLIGAIVGSTDAAAVFSLLSTRAVRLNNRISSALEIESGTNDPMAVMLTIGLVHYLLAPNTYGAMEIARLLGTQIIFGVALGYAGGYLLIRTLNEVTLGDSLYPLLAMFGGLLIYGVTATVGGSGFLAVYLAGLMLGNQPVRAFASIKRFHDGIAWLAQIGMFLVLGLLATPSRMVDVAIPALILAAVLTFIARPIAVAASLLPFHFPWREQIYMGWVGLRGSVPMVLATFPLLAGLKNATLFFDVAFFIVLVSLIVQGWTVAPAARLLGLQMPPVSTRVRRADIDLPGTRGYEIVSYRLARSSALIGKRPKALPIEDSSRIVSLTRAGKLLPYKDWGVLKGGDYLSLIVSKAELPELDKLFQQTRGNQGVEQQRFFGEFIISPEARVSDLVDAYGLDVPVAAGGWTLSAFVSSVVHKPVVGDRLRLGEMELVVRKMEGDKIVELGLRLPHG
ncbi:potassium/proton antiporter [Nevskia sp.]|uniref:potassium/proton antiporter n=1 Tax=Nevskia sp. TaxID=1929292 RepID=UPI0025ED2B25|nr:potassium/proton antiporter [Nevskia sp.]